MIRKEQKRPVGQTIKLFREIFKKDNVRDYIVLFLVIGYTFLVFYRVIKMKEKIPESFFGLVMGAFAYYFRSRE